MAAGGVFLAAHQCHAIPLDTVTESLDTLCELARFRQPTVEHAAVGVVKLVSVRPPANHVS